MHKHKTRVRSDRFNEHMESMKEYGMEMGDTIPVDLYGKRITQGKNGNLQNIAEDVKEFYDLEGDAGF